MLKIIKNKKYRIELNKSKINYMDFYTNNPYKYLEKNKDKLFKYGTLPIKIINQSTNKILNIDTYTNWKNKVIDWLKSEI